MRRAPWLLLWPHPVHGASSPVSHSVGQGYILLSPSISVTALKLGCRALGESAKRGFHEEAKKASSVLTGPHASSGLQLSCCDPMLVQGLRRLWQQEA